MTAPAARTCPVCAVPVDAGVFDDSSIAAAPGPGEEVVLARFELHPSYCGVLNYFAQFTDAHAQDPAAVETPGLQWQIRSNGQPLAPWLTFERIINPWGLSGFPIHVRLEEGCLLELVVRNVTVSPGGIGLLISAPVNRVGGRLLGRYWYNSMFGDEEPRP
jgi:hypothetical protein